MRIAYVTNIDAREIGHWSGTVFFIWDSLARRGVEVELVHSLSMPAGVRLLVCARSAFYSRIFKRLYLPDRDVVVARAFSRQIGKQLASLPRVDAVLVPGGTPVAFLPGNVPLIVYGDATFRSLVGLYSHFQTLSGTSLRHGEIVTAATYRRASACVFASQWAAESAIQDYQVDAAKVQVVPLGANLSSPPSAAEVESAIKNRDQKRVRLLFIGVDWERKGGRLAVETARTLIKMGIPAHLCVIGCNPALGKEEAKFVTVRGFIGKDSGGEQQIREELAQSHFLIVPSLAECYGLVYCEASAYGVPSIARDVGGVGSAVRNGHNGRLFGLKTSAEEIAAWVAPLFKDIPSYHKLAFASRAEFESRLNWDVAGEALERIIRNAVGKNANTGKEHKEPALRAAS